MNYSELDTTTRLPEETRMEMPEMSYGQELLARQVPFENRVEFLSDFSKVDDTARSITDIAKNLNISAQAALRMAKELGASSHEVRGEERFEPYTREVILEEIEWQNYYDQLDDVLSAQGVAEALDRHPDWVRHNAAMIDVYPERRMGRNNQPALLYDKSVVDSLRYIGLHFPPANDWRNIDDLQDELGKSYNWIISRVEEYGLRTQPRMLATSRKVTTHYAPETVAALRVVRDSYPPAAGEWRNAHEIAQELSKDLDWVRGRLKAFSEQAQERVASSNRVYDHYPPEVFEQLKSAATEYEDAGDWMTVAGIAKHIGRDYNWVKARIAPYEEQAETRLAVNNRRPRTHYPPGVVLELKRKNDASQTTR